MTASHEQLLRKGRTAAAAGVKDLCLKATTNEAEAVAALETVDELLREILDPRKAIDDADALDWLKHLLAGGDAFEEFASKCSAYDDAVTCGFVWTSNFVAYRCRTCGVSPCMSLCADCFHRGDHEGHDFNMFRSQAGGACDCGDVSVMRSDGFCGRHGPQHVGRASPVPPELARVPEVALPPMLFRLALELRSFANARQIGTYKLDLREVDGYVEFLQSLTHLGAGFKRILGRCLSSKEVYAKLTHPRRKSEGSGGGGGGKSNQRYADFVKESQETFAATIPTVAVPACPRRLVAEMPSLDSEDLIHESLLDEFLFWIVKYEFPQSLVTFLLTMLPDVNERRRAFENEKLKNGRKRLI